MDVFCTTCGAMPFDYCVYVDGQVTRQRGVVGKRIYKSDGRPYYHSERKYAQWNFNHTYVVCGRGPLRKWLTEFSSILTDVE